MIHRQNVSVWKHEKEGDKALAKTGKNIVLPAVFSTGIRTDIVNFVHTNISKNRRQGHAVNFKAGMKHSAESWGTGRAVSRIPCVEREECLLQLEFGEDGTEETISSKKDMLLLLH